MSEEVGKRGAWFFEDMERMFADSIMFSDLSARGEHHCLMTALLVALKQNRSEQYPWSDAE
jgi:hypothetical protein